jgi:hypothetical protein
MTDDNVIPIVAYHDCASCRARIESMRVYAGHTDECMQPEIRMRRAEQRIAHLLEVVHQLVGSNNDSVELIGELNKRLAALESTHGEPKNPESEPVPTVRSGASYPVELTGESCSACYFGRPHPDASAAESPGEAPAGAEPASYGPDWSS